MTTFEFVCFIAIFYFQIKTFIILKRMGKDE